ncbi:MAG: hypothetical protein EAZ55_04975 [Cytophagales bacterium]|nr:MAG: hypothetical protein EAZ55_04975 [Cytophagales bacterium]
MKKIGLFTLLLLTLGLNAYAQYTFKVLMTVGTVTNGSSKIFTGATLGPNEQLSVASGSTLSLMYTGSGGGTVTINKGGTYPVKTLEQQLLTYKSQNPSTTGKVINFVIGEMAKTSGNINEDRNKYMRVTGSVERASEEESFAIKLFLPQTGANNSQKPRYTLSPKVYVFWQPEENEKLGDTYTITIENLAYETIKTFDVTGSSFVLDFDEPVIFNNQVDGAAKTVYVTIASKESPSKISNKYAIVQLYSDDADYADFFQKYQDFKKSQDKEMPESMRKIDEAFFFEQNGFIHDVIRCYEEAIALEPENEAYKIAYLGFLQRAFPNEEKKK